MFSAIRLQLVLLFSLCASFVHAAPGIEVVSKDLSRPWGMAEVAPGKLLISSITGRFSLFDTQSRTLTPIKGAPAVRVSGQGGLLDVAVPPEYQPGDWIYFTYSKPVGDEGATTLARAKLDMKTNSLTSWQDLLVTQSVSSTSHHYGSRIAFLPGYVFFTVGDRGARESAQDRSSHNGSVIRLNRDGSVPDDNPFVGVKGALPEIWSYGHRNPQGLAVDSEGRLWEIEHGPRGGDEINLIQPGLNYGWPEVSQGKEYWNPLQVGVSEKAGMEPAKKVYVPSIAPGSLIFMEHDTYGWQGDLLAGALKLQHLNRITLKGDEAVGEQRYFEDRGQRIRALLEDHKGTLWLATDGGELWRVLPE